jgi:hypothetical protein
MRKGDIVFVAACSYFTPLLSTLLISLYLQLFSFHFTFKSLKRSPNVPNFPRKPMVIQIPQVVLNCTVSEDKPMFSKEFTQFLFVAKGSAAEVQSLLYVAIDQEYISDTDFKTAYEKADEVARILSGFITSLLRRSTGARTR